MAIAVLAGRIAILGGTPESGVVLPFADLIGLGGVNGKAVDSKNLDLQHRKAARQLIHEAVQLRGFRPVPEPVAVFFLDGRDVGPEVAPKCVAKGTGQGDVVAFRGDNDLFDGAVPIEHDGDQRHAYDRQGAGYRKVSK